MPSPFPGMDPFLEAPKLFPGFHNRFINSTAAKLEQILPAGYFADISETVWVEASERIIEPDANIHHVDGGVDVPGLSGGTAIAMAVKPIVIQAENEPRKETYLEIFQVQDPEPKLVCAIEVLSLVNKTPGGKRHALYLLMQQEILESQTHLIEIDLLRAGNHATAVPLPLARGKATFDYHVCCHRCDTPNIYYFYPILLTDRLPVIAVPLLPGTQDVALDLQGVFDRAYDDGPYRRRVNYRVDKPVPPLRPDQEKWMATHLAVS